MSEIQDKAKAGLDEELEKTAEPKKSFMAKIIPHIKKRIDEDEGLAADVLQEHKNFARCYDYIVAKARALLGGRNGGVESEIVFEWAEDYYRADDKKLAQEEAENRKKREQRQKEAAEKKKKTAQKPKKAAGRAKKAEPKKEEKKQEFEQMDLFSLFGQEMN